MFEFASGARGTIGRGPSEMRSGPGLNAQMSQDDVSVHKASSINLLRLSFIGIGPKQQLKGNIRGWKNVNGKQWGKGPWAGAPRAYKSGNYLKSKNPQS